jgi:alanine racemase
MSRPTVAEINLDAIEKNFLCVRKMARGARVCAAVKADAYGHGALAACRAMSGADMFAVATVLEGAELREAGIKTPILMLGSAAHDEEEVIRRDIATAVCSTRYAERLSKAAVAMGKKARVHIKVDTGMGRLGVQDYEAPGFACAVASLPGIEVEGIFTHLPSADEEDASFSTNQIARFVKVTEEVEAAGVHIPIRHAANSAAIVNYPQSYLDMVRPGIVLYNSYNGACLSAAPCFRQAMTFKTKIMFLKELPPGSPVSYGRTFTTGARALMATIPVGYADGYNRLLSNKGEALVRGMRVPVAGRVCMDQVMLDVTRVPGVSEGDEVVLWGRQGGEFISVEEVASLTGTISYEVTCSVSKRVPRVYVHRG